MSADGGVMGTEMVEVRGGRGGGIALGLVMVRGRICERVEKRRSSGGGRAGWPGWWHRRAVYVQPGVLFLPLGPPVLEPYLHLGLGKRQRQCEIQPLTHRQVPRRLELVLQRHQLLVRERRAGPTRFAAASVFRTAATAPAAMVNDGLGFFRAAAGRGAPVHAALVPVVADVAAASVAAYAYVLVVLVHRVVPRTVFACENKQTVEINIM